MTIKELYEWAKEKGIENYSIEFYDSEFGSTFINDVTTEINNKTEEVIIYG